MDAFTIIIICAFGLVLLAAYLIFRIGALKRKMRRLDAISRDIGDMERTSAGGSPRIKKAVIETPMVPEGELLIILNRGNRKPWMDVVSGRLRAGNRGVVVTVKVPSSVRSRFRGDVKFIWLDRSTAHDVDDDTVIVNPTNLSGVLQDIESFVGEGGIVLVDGFAEILASNEDRRVIRFLRMLESSCAARRFSAVVPAPYRSVSQRTRVLLTESFQTVVI
ncbi:hypothetical protein B6U90_02000 [Thermoplasmatales archaeon ex4484_6]|nr:MAG: hypothetical protein B6U90_02000 [Thermoplasmatales archaeon ex4484_6]RLF65476.1 MAG: hypothetical protein DRN57_09045 [Thermoplasmata archaeon]